MIIVDYSQVVISNYMIQVGKFADMDIDTNLFRHMILNSIKGYKKKFGAQYGEIVIACDSPNSWRKDVFPYYKANRKTSREKSTVNWTQLFECLSTVREELEEYFPYRVIRVPRAEADDIIGVLANEYGNQLGGEPLMIISGDKDFIQLQSNMNVKQYNPVIKKNVTHASPELYLKEHIIRGDTGDGVPNFMSNDDQLVLGTRAKPIMTKNLERWVKMKPEEFCTSEYLRNWYRNQQLVDLNFTPDEIKTAILEAFRAQESKDRSKLFDYFIKYKLTNLTEHIGDF
jgi:5'-3' exonuclease